MRAPWLRDLLELLVPPACARCGAAVAGEAALCPPCDRSLPRPSPLADCPRCQERRALAGGPCAACRRERSPLAACVAAARFEGEVETWIRRFKYPQPGLSGLDPGAMAVALALAREAAAAAPGPVPDRVVPVPLHPGRLRARGFSPACALARAVAREVGAPLDPVALRRIRDTSSQTGLDRAARRRNVRDAFRVRAGRAVPPCVWLVDDVVTTGSTLTAAARPLRGAGARRVVAVCAARTPAFGSQTPERG